MENREILVKAIRLAIDGGWNELESKDCTILPIVDWILDGSITVWNSYLNDKLYIPYPCILFDPLFAKALWGERDEWSYMMCSCGGRGVHATDDKHALDCDRVKSNRGYKYHLRQMVIAEDPIKYLSENMGD